MIYELPDAELNEERVLAELRSVEASVEVRSVRVNMGETSWFEGRGSRVPRGLRAY